jgi:hypothetical protein
MDSDTILREALRRSQSVLGRFGVVAAPARDAYDARRVLTVDRPAEEVEKVLADPSRSEAMFGPGAALSGVGAARGQEFALVDGGRAVVELRPGPGGSTEVVVEVHVESVTDGRPRYGRTAAVVALRAAHRVRSLTECGEVASLASNPAGRDAPDPYGD